MPAAKREYSSTPSDPPQTPKKKSKSVTSAASPSTPKSKKKADGASTPGSGKKSGAWSGDELKMLYSIMCPKRTGVRWEDVAGQIPGRDAKSCNNKWSRMQGKIMEAIESMGE